MILPFFDRHGMSIVKIFWFSWTHKCFTYWIIPNPFIEVVSLKTSSFSYMYFTVVISIHEPCELREIMMLALTTIKFLCLQNTCIKRKTLAYKNFRGWLSPWKLISWIFLTRKFLCLRYCATTCTCIFQSCFLRNTFDMQQSLTFTAGMLCVNLYTSRCVCVCLYITVIVCM